MKRKIVWINCSKGNVFLIVSRECFRINCQSNPWETAKMKIAQLLWCRGEELQITYSLNYGRSFLSSTNITNPVNLLGFQHLVRNLFHKFLSKMRHKNLIGRKKSLRCCNCRNFTTSKNLHCLYHFTTDNIYWQNYWIKQLLFVKRQIPSLCKMYKFYEVIPPALSKDTDIDS